MATEVSVFCQKVVTGLDQSIMAAGVNMPDIGLIKAALSPQNSRIINALIPERADGTVSFDTDGDPSVNLDFRQANDTLGTVVTTPSCSGTTAKAKKMRQNYVIDQYAQLGYKMNNATADQICEEYDRMEAIHAAQHSTRSSVGGKFRNTINAELVDRIKKILQTVDTNAATVLTSGIGVNLKYDTADAQPIKLVNYNDPQKGPLDDFEIELDNLAILNTMVGRPIIITDSLDVRNYFKKLGIGCCSDVGLNYANLMNQPYEVYYSTKITALLGDGVTKNNIIVAYPESFVMVNIDKWRNIQLAAGSNKIANTTFGAFSIIEPSIRFADVALIQEVGVPRMTFDLRIKETDCTDDAAAFALDFLPSLQYKFITAPANSDGVTGIFHYTVDNGVTP